LDQLGCDSKESTVLGARVEFIGVDRSTCVTVLHGIPCSRQWLYGKTPQNIRSIAEKETQDYDGGISYPAPRGDASIYKFPNGGRLAERRDPACWIDVSLTFRRCHNVYRRLDVALVKAVMAMQEDLDKEQRVMTFLNHDCTATKVKNDVLVAVLLCIFSVTAASQTTDAPTHPLTLADIVGLLRGSVNTRRVRTLIQEQGVSFVIDSQIEKQIRAAGGDDSLLLAIKEISRKQGPGTNQQAPKLKTGTNAEQIASLVVGASDDCTVSVNGTSFDIKAGETKKVAAEVGENLVEAVSKKGEAASWHKVVQVSSSEQKAVFIEFQMLADNTTTTMRTEAATGTIKVNPKDGQIYVWIAPGSFQMGCSPGDNECSDNEKPSHAVTISRGFWIAQTLVPQAAYTRVRGNNPSQSQGERLPVDRVKWDDASSYCAAVGLRLPSEAEWEYAARAGSGASRYGDLDAIAWYSRNSGYKTHDVGLKQENAWKLYDPLGNVWEWTNDWYDAIYYSQSPSQDPRGPKSGEYRVVRGGSFEYDARGVRVSYRSAYIPSSAFRDVGFRCAGEVP